MSLETQISALASRVAAEVKGIKAKLNGAGNATNLVVPGSLVKRDDLYGGADFNYINLALPPAAPEQAASKGYVDLTGLDRPGGFQPPGGDVSIGTRRAAFSWGNGGEGTFTDRNTAFQRLPIVLPVTTKRWRLRISNRTPGGVSTGAGTVNYGPFYIMDAFRNFQTGDPIQWSGTPAYVMGASGNQGANTEWVSGWVTNPSLQILAGRMRHLQMSWTKTAGSTVYCSSGGSFWSTNMADITATAPGMNYAANSAFAVTLEYEFVGSNKILVAVGDSITEGAGARYNFLSWHQQLSMRLKMPVCLSAQFGSFAGSNGTENWGSTPLTQPRYQRLRDAGCNIDAGIMFLGTNETAWGGTLTSVQDGLLATSRRMTSEWKVRDAYACTIPPQNASGARETLRTQINNWMRSGTSAEFSIFDPAVLMEAGVNSATLRPGYEGPGGDATHFGPAGHMRFIDAIQLPA